VRVPLKIKLVVGMGVRANLLEPSPAMPRFQGQLSMRLDVSTELSTGDGSQCARSMRLGGQNVDPVVTPSLRSAAAQWMKQRHSGGNGEALHCL
jgi:hypothetical protein